MADLSDLEQIGNRDSAKRRMFAVRTAERKMPPLRCAWWATLLIGLALSGPMSTARAVTSGPVITIHTDELAGPTSMGLGVEWDPYDTFQPTHADWNRMFQRLDYMRPGFIRVVVPAYNYFGGYDQNNNPVYRWTSDPLVQLRTILDYAQSRGITVVLGDWSNPLINDDARIPAYFLAQLHDVYGYTNIKYYNLFSEPNNGTGCDFGCWTGIVKGLSTEFTGLGLTKWLQLVGPDNSNSWDDTSGVQALDRTSGLDTDVPWGGDSWVTNTLQTIPNLIGAYDSHRYSTVWGIENGVYEDQMRARREQISNLDSPSKPYFAGEVGLVPTQVPWTDSQPDVEEFGYGVRMADTVIQAIDAGLSGASAWDLDDAMHNRGPYGSQHLKQWGFWNSLGGQDGYPASDLQLRPWYYPWSVLARSFPAGSQLLVTPSSGISGLRVAAAKVPSAGGYALSFAVVNDSDTPQSITLSVPSATGPLTLARYDYFDGERPTNADGFPVPAQILPDVRLADGLRVELPSRGVVVLSSLGLGSSGALNDGTRTLVDDLDNWGKTSSRSAGLTLDHSDPAQFNDDRSRAASTTGATQYVIYRASQITSFELKAYYQDTPGIRAYGSEDGTTWTPIGLESTNPAPALGGGGSYLVDLLPNEGLPAATNELKIELTNTSTELSQVRIQYARGGPACLAPPLQAGFNSLGGLPLGTGYLAVWNRIGIPSGFVAQTWRYCIEGSGELAVEFGAGNGVSLIASTASSYRPGGIGPGSSVASMRRRYRRARRLTVNGQIFIARLRQGEVVFLVHTGVVQAVAIATQALLHRDGSLSRALEYVP